MSQKRTSTVDRQQHKFLHLMPCAFDETPPISEVFKIHEKNKQLTT